MFEPWEVSTNLNASLWPRLFSWIVQLPVGFSRVRSPLPPVSVIPSARDKGWYYQNYKSHLLIMASKPPPKSVSDLCLLTGGLKIDFTAEAMVSNLMRRLFSKCWRIVITHIPDSLCFRAKTSSNRRPVLRLILVFSPFFLFFLTKLPFWSEAAP